MSELPAGRIIDTQQWDRARWLAWRTEGIGASDVAAIVGLSPWSSPWSLWAEKLGLLGEREDDVLMEAGRWLELAIAPWVQDRTGLVVRGAQTCVESTADPVHRCTLDGLVHEGPGSTHPLGVLEIKTAGPGRTPDQPPAHHAAQAQWQMHVTGLQRTWLATLRGRRLDITEIARDDEDIAFLVARSAEFWQLVQEQEPPPVDGSVATLDALAAVHATPDPDLTAPLDDLGDVLDEWRSAKADERDAAARRRSAEARLKARLGDAVEGLVDGERAVTWRAQTRRDIDVTRLREEYPDVARMVTRESTHRVLRDTTAGR